MPKIQSTEEQGFFKIDNNLYPKGAYTVEKKGDYVGIKPVGSFGYLIAPIIYTQWTDENDAPFASINDLITAIGEIFFLVNVKTWRGGWNWPLGAWPVSSKEGYMWFTTVDLNNPFIPAGKLLTAKIDGASTENDYIIT